MQLRPDQQQLKDDIYTLWNAGKQNVLGVLATGGGKTVIASDILRRDWGPSLAIAHRQELVSQISLTLGHCGITHRLIAPRNVVSFIRSYHRAELGGKCFVNPDAPAAVAGVDTLLRMDYKFDAFLRGVKFWFTDEAHHLLATNKWGKAVGPFIDRGVHGLGLTATPERADGRGLGSWNDGVFDAMAEGISMRDLIEQGSLTDYRVFCPPSDMDLGGLRIGTTGDFGTKQLKTASQKSHIVGDVVAHYKRIAGGLRGVTFATDVDTAGQMAADFQASEVRAQAVSAKTPDHLRAKLIRDFRNGLLDQLVNVDLFGEGFDLPAISVVSMARPTQSYGLFAQQFGRALRPLEGKDTAIIIDHVGNTVRHGLPDAPRQWSLEAREKRSGGGSDALPLTVCGECYQPHESYRKECPHCGYIRQPKGRTLPEQVDGDLTELTPEALAAMRGAVDTRSEQEVYMDFKGKGLGDIPARGQANRHREKLEARAELADALAHWGGYWKAQGLNDAERYRHFYQQFGMDVLTAQSQSRADMAKMSDLIRSKLP